MEQLPDRFWDKVYADPNSGCWLWGASCGPTGYGQFWVGLATKLAHRVSYEAHIGPIPEGLELDHLCRIRSCVNPDHLEAVTHKENMSRGKLATKIHCIRGHKFEGENLYVMPTGKRVCKTCRRASDARRTRKAA